MRSLSIKKAIKRLDVYVVGDRLHQKKSVEQLCHKRLERDVQSKVEIPDHLRKENHKLRPSRKKAEAAPNAPLLKRMVRNPQSLEKDYFRKVEMERMRLEPRERITFPQIVKEELRRDKKVRKIQAMSYHIQPSTINIPKIDEWLGARLDKSE